MKKFISLVCYILAIVPVGAQNDLDILLAAGIEDAERFANDYLKSGTNGLMHSMNAGWFNTAKAKPFGGFEISIITSASLISDESKTFNLNSADYNNIEFVQGSSSQMVSTVLGDNDSDVFVELTYNDPVFGNLTQQISLPTGIGSGTANMLPTAFIQGGLGLSKGIELKARFLPKIETEDVSLMMYGTALQVEFTKWLPADKLWPIAISGLVAYTNLTGEYTLTASSGISGDNQKIDNNTNTWLFQFITSTRMPIINFYAGLGYIKGESKSDMLGTYSITDGTFTTEAIVDPFSVSSNISAVRGTIGAKLKIGFFRLNAEYHLSDFNAFSLGINFGFR